MIPFVEEHSEKREIVHLQFELEEEQYGIYAYEYRGACTVKEGCKKADILACVVDEQKTATSDMLNKTCSRLDNASGRLTRRICFARGPSVRDLVLDFMFSFSFSSPKPCPRTPGHNTYYKRYAHFCKLNLSKRKNRMHQRLAGAGSGTESGYRAARRLDFCLRLCYTTLHWFASNVRS